MFSPPVESSTASTCRDNGTSPSPIGSMPGYPPQISALASASPPNRRPVESYKKNDGTCRLAVCVLGGAPMRRGRRHGLANQDWIRRELDLHVRGQPPGTRLTFSRRSIGACRSRVGPIAWVAPRRLWILCVLPSLSWGRPLCSAAAAPKSVFTRYSVAMLDTEEAI